MKILVIEDNKKHLADAKNFFNSVISSGKNIEVEYAENYVEAQEKMKKSFDGVISDIFFPYSNDMPWSSDIAEKCYQTLKEVIDERKNYSRRDPYALEAHMNQSMAEKKWRNGETMHPSGVLFIEEVDLPIVFCSDMNHHAHSYADVFHYIQEKNKILIHIVDVEGDRNVFRAVKKRWDDAYKEFIFSFVANEMGIKVHEFYGGSEELRRQFKEKVSPYLNIKTN